MCYITCYLKVKTGKPYDMSLKGLFFSIYCYIIFIYYPKFGSLRLLVKMTYSYIFIKI